MLTARLYIVKLMRYLYWHLVPLLWRLPFKQRNEGLSEVAFTFGIVTYADRFDSYFKPLITILMRSFPDIKAIVVLNGHYDSMKQNKYLDEALYFLSQYPSIKVIKYHEPEGLSKLWNQIIYTATTNKILMLNDDLKISPWFRTELISSEILNEEIALINRSWSHFLISKNTIKKNGWFDERFPAIGNEDEDYETRLVLNKIELPVFKFRQILNVVDIPKEYSYGKKPDLVHVKYIKANQDLFHSKWDVSSHQKPGFVYVEILNAYLKLKEGMDTPNFYDMK